MPRRLFQQEQGEEKDIFALLTLGKIAPDTMRTIAARSQYYAWADRQIRLRGIDTIFYGVAADLTGTGTLELNGGLNFSDGLLTGGIKTLDSGVDPFRGFAYTEPAKQFLKALNFHLLGYNIRTIRGILTDGTLAVTGSPKPLRYYGDNLDTILIQKEQTLAQAFMKTYPGWQRIVVDINRAMNMPWDHPIAGILRVPYIARAHDVVGSLNYGLLEHKITVGQCYAQWLRSRQHKIPPIHVSGELDSGIDVFSQESLTFQASGKLDWFKSPVDSRVITCGPSGTESSYGHRKFLFYKPPPEPKENDGALIGYIRTRMGNSPFFFIGDQKTVKMPTMGRLIFLVNDSYPDDNSGYFEVKVRK